MRRSVRKAPKRIGRLAVAAALLGIVLFFFAAGRIHARLEARKAASFSPGEIREVILDPGHGGADGGAVGADGTAEKDLNLAIALKLRDLLVFQGYQVYLTRETDTMTCDEGITGIARQKRSDMHNRLKLMNDHPEAVVLSIHQNLFEKEQYWGAQMFCNKLFRDFLIIFANVVKCRNSPVLRAFPAFSVSEDTPHISAFFSLTLPPKVVKME